MGLLQKTNRPASPTPKPFKPLSTVELMTAERSNKPREEFPVPVYQFSIEMDGAIVAFFQSVTGLSVSRAVEQLTEGGLNNHIHEFPGQISYAHITFEVGMTSSDFFWEWMMDGQYESRAQLKDFVLIQRGPNPDLGERDKEIFKEIRSWNFFKAFPVSWRISDLSIDASDKIVIETLELSFDYFESQKS